MANKKKTNSIDLNKVPKKYRPYVIILIVVLAIGFFIYNEFFYEELKEPVLTQELYEVIEDVPLAGTGLEDELSVSGDPDYLYVNNNVPTFTNEEISLGYEAFEDYSDLDSLGRAGEAYASIGTELMPTSAREDISSVKPSGWYQNYYDFVENGYLYNRSHLIAYQLAGENANEKNLITGTRSFNVEMIQFEELVGDYVRETDGQVLYRVTPVYSGDNLLASGVLMEAYSIDDGGESVSFNVFVLNKEDGVDINYATGENTLAQ